MATNSKKPLRKAATVAAETPPAVSSVVVNAAREHNVKGVDFTLLRCSLTTSPDVSGSGKSSVGCHTAYQEGQRCFLRRSCSCARQVLGPMMKPKVNRVEGVSPVDRPPVQVVNGNGRAPARRRAEGDG